MADQKTGQILTTAFGVASQHDFHLFKRTHLTLAEPIRLLADAGYQSLAHLHPNCQTPLKKSKHHPLTASQTQANRALARQRILIEHIFRRLKVFRILSEKYRNRRQKFALRFNLIAALYNHELNST